MTRTFAIRQRHAAASDSASTAQRATSRGSDSASRTIPVRRLATDPASVQLDDWLVPGDPYMSHFLATLSAVFPRGEEFFVHSVRRCRGHVAGDPVLAGQVKGFIGQEAMHGRSHRSLNRRLADAGYRTVEADAAISRACDRLSALRSPLLPIAATAAAEHLTGIFGEIVLADERTRSLLFSQPEIHALIVWHAVEELEHKNVAFDVMEAAGAGYPTRVAGLVLTLAVLARTVAREWVSALWAMRRDLTWRHRLTFLRHLPRQRLLHPVFAWRTLAYLRPRFHPDDTSTHQLVEVWRRRLAETGTVTVATPRSAA